MNRALHRLLATVIALLVSTGCKHTSQLPSWQNEPKTRQPPEEIRRKIVGLWTIDQDAGGPEPILSLNLQPTGDFSVVVRGPNENWMEKPIDESTVVHKTGKWCSDSGLMLVFENSNIPLDCDGVILSTNSIFYPIVYVNDHELVCTPGISMGGRIRFLKYFQ